MRSLIFLSFLVLTLLTSAHSQGFLVKTSYPENGAYNVPSAPNTILFKLAFSELVDTARNFFNPEMNLPRFLHFLAFDPLDSIQFVQPYVPLRADTVGVWIKLAPNTDYCVILMGAYSRIGVLLEKPYVLNFTTAPTRGNRTVSGTITLPSGRLLTPLKIFNADLFNFKLTGHDMERASQSLVLNNIQLLNRENLVLTNSNLQSLQPQILSISPNWGVVGLLDGNPLVQERVNIRYAANVNSDFSFAINYVRDGTYYLFAAFDSQRDGVINPRSGDLIMFYDANGDGQPDQITISGNVSGLNLGGAFQVRPFTTNQVLDTIKSIVRSYASDAKLRWIETFEGIEVPWDILDGKVYFARYWFYSPSRDRYLSVDANAFMGFFLDTLSSPYTRLVDLPTTFIDSDSAFRVAEANGGYAFRSEPNTVTSITYELRNFLTDVFPPAPDTINPYWRIWYIKFDTSFRNLTGIFMVYLHPSDGRLASKFEMTFKPFTAKEKFRSADSVAKSYASDARLVFVGGQEGGDVEAIVDTSVDGKCYFWVYGYRSATKGKFAVFLLFGSPLLQEGWPQELPSGFLFEKTLNLAGYKDSDFLAPIAEVNGGSQFKAQHRLDQQIYFYSQSLDTSKIYFHSMYIGIDTVASERKTLIILLDPVTGNYVDRVIVNVAKDPTVEVPTDFALHQNYPNPFNPSTTITYDIPIRTKVRLVVYNILGQEVAVLVDGEQEAGRYSVRFESFGLPSGVYFYRLEAGKFIEVKKMMIVK